MHQRKLVVMEDDDEKRTMSWGEADDGLTYVRETTMGTVTEFAYGERGRLLPVRHSRRPRVLGHPVRERGSHPPVRCLAATEKDEKSEKIGYAPCKTHGALS